MSVAPCCSASTRYCRRRSTSTGAAEGRKRCSSSPAELRESPIGELKACEALGMCKYLNTGLKLSSAIVYQLSHCRATRRTIAPTQRSVCLVDRLPFNEDELLTFS